MADINGTDTYCSQGYCPMDSFNGESCQAAQHDSAENVDECDKVFVNNYKEENVIGP